MLSGSMAVAGHPTDSEPGEQVPASGAWSSVEPASSVVARRRSRGWCLIVRPAAMHRAAIVPDHQIADPPFVAVDELRLRRVRVRSQQQQPAVRHRPADDVRGVRRQIQRLAPRAGMPAHQTLRRRRVLFALARRELGEADLAARPEHVVLARPVRRSPPSSPRAARRRRRACRRTRSRRCRTARAAAARPRAACRARPAPACRRHRCATAGCPGCRGGAGRRRRADLVVRVQVGDVADLRDGEPAGPPRAAARPISSGPKRAANRAVVRRSAAGRGRPPPRSGRWPTRCRQRSRRRSGRQDRHRRFRRRTRG